MKPGEIIVNDTEITLNEGSEEQVIIVSNAGDRPIQVGSHYHFAETNSFLKFDRDAAAGMRLNIPSGTAIRFEPGQSREVALIPIMGDRVIYGFNKAVMGGLNHE